MTADALTKPERYCTRAQGRQIRARLLEAGGCEFCTRRAPLFEGVGRISVCGLDPPKQFPLCVALRGGFDFDERAFLKGPGKAMNTTDSPRA